jgi:hypothetical protein
MNIHASRELSRYGDGVGFPAGRRNISLLHKSHNGFGPHTMYYSMGTRGIFPYG